MKRVRGIGLLVVALVAVGAIAATPAMASTGNVHATATQVQNDSHILATEDSVLSDQVEAAIAEVPLASLRAEITQTLSERADAESIEGFSVDYSPYVVEGSAAAARALPTGCGQASITYKNGNTIWNQVFSSCTNRTWSDLDYHLRLVRINPYNPYDTKIIKDSYPDMPAGNSASYDQTLTCRNTSLTNWDGYARGSMVIGGTTYVAETGDTEYRVNCGW